MFILERSDNGAKVGFIRVDGSVDEKLISIAISYYCRGKGYGRMAIEKLKELYPSCYLYAEIHENNQPSIELFIRAGFKEMEDYDVKVGDYRFREYRYAPC